MLHDMHQRQVLGYLDRPSALPDLSHMSDISYSSGLSDISGLYDLSDVSGISDMSGMYNIYIYQVYIYIYIYLMYLIYSIYRTCPTWVTLVFVGTTRVAPVPRHTKFHT